MSINRGFDPKPTRKGFVTNFPPYQHWKKGDAEEMLREKPLVIYVHTPFCAQQCSYCHYVTEQGGRRIEMDRYTNALCEEISRATERFHLSKRPVISVYFGGGTPTLLSEENLNQLMDCLRRNLEIDPEAEISVEAEPVTLTETKTRVLKDLKVNRISLGLQSLADDIIKLTNRHDTEKKALQAIEYAKNTGAVVNIDLMSGLAGESWETWKYTVEKALATEVQSITLYKTELYANTEYFMDLRKKKIVLPSDEEEIDFTKYMLEKLDQEGYQPWSFFTFTKGGRYESAYAPSIWKGADCYAFGVSAFGVLDSWLYQNTNDLGKYLKMVEEGELPVNRGYHLSSLDQIKRHVLLVMKMPSLNLKEFQERFGFSLKSLCPAVLEELESEGYISVSEGEIIKTPKGLLYGDYPGKKMVYGLGEMQ